MHTIARFVPHLSVAVAHEAAGRESDREGRVNRREVGSQDQDPQRTARRVEP